MQEGEEKALNRDGWDGGNTCSSKVVALRKRSS